MRFRRLVAAVGLLALGCGSERPATTDEPSPSPTDLAGTEPPAETVPVPVYFTRDTPMGQRLIRETRDVAADNRLVAAVHQVAAGPTDPDYATLWPAAAAVAQVSLDGIGADAFFGVRFTDDADVSRPAGMSEAEARLALQQLVLTMQGEPRTRTRVLFHRGHDQVKEVLGVDTTEPLPAEPDLDVLALMNIDTPREGQVVEGDKLVATGLNNGFEGTVWWRLLREDQVLDEGALISGGAYGDRLWPWRTVIDVRDLPPGEYVFTAGNDDPTGGTEGMGTSEDTRTFTIR